jgi:glucokinase
MEELFAKMGEYVKMEDELAFAEFRDYYQQLIDYLMKSYQDLSAEQLVKAKGITMILAINAKARTMKKDENRKKFAKMAEKAAFWEGAIKARLLKEGMAESELDAQVEALWD